MKISDSINCLLVLTLVFSPSVSFANNQKPPRKVHAEVIERVSGRDVAELLAATCEPEHFQRFGEWAHKTKFLNQTISDQLFEIDLKEKSGKVSTSEYTYSIASNGRMSLQMNGGGLTEGDDACDVFMNYIAKQDFKKKFANRLMNFLIPEANAITTQGDTAVEAMKSARVAAGGGMSNTAKVVLVGLSTGLVGLAAAEVFGFFDKTKKRFNNFIKKGFSVDECSAESVTLSNGKRKIEITKQPVPTKIEMYKPNGKKVVGDKKARNKAKKAYDKIMKLADACDSSEDASNMNAKLKGTALAATASVNALGTSSGGAPVIAAPSRSESSPSRASQ